jgi:hypothetical protein
MKGRFRCISEETVKETRYREDLDRAVLSLYNHSLKLARNFYGDNNAFSEALVSQTLKKRVGISSNPFFDLLVLTRMFHPVA